MSDAVVFNSPDAVPGCELCAGAGGVPLWSDAHWRLVRVDDLAFPAFYRVVAQRHIGEWSDCDADLRSRCMDLVCAVERTLIARLRPTKVNLASLGNVVPHLHWHVVARFDWDSHFPQPIWGMAQRTVQPSAIERLALPLPALDAAVVAAVRAL